MQLNTGNISHKIIQAQMKNIPLKFENLPISKDLKFGLYSYDQKPVYTQIKDGIDFSQQNYRHGNSLFYIDHGAAGHLGVSYVVVKKSNLSNKIKTLLKDIVLVAFTAYLIVAFIGYYLAKLFIYPIQSQREKLNIFIKNATHELNTPVSALLLCVNSNNFYTEKNRNLIKISAKKISNLYKDLSYITLKKHKSKNLKNLELSGILQKELLYHIILAEKKRITLTSELEETFFKLEEEDFIRLTNNLITNAIKYTKRYGSIKITLKNNTLTIKDSGIGIAKNRLDKIFKRYYRATDEVGGFGIGLDIVYSICKTYGVKISVDSKKNEGTVFSLTFS
ncbi:MAG: HAMP domain-containing sensor histidine kinase [Sulfurospirillum sp.]